jgi:hypothetical protein
MDLQADSLDAHHFSEQRVYRRTVAGRNGAVLNGEDLVFMKGARLLTETRLAPNETKTETFSFSVPRGIQMRGKASLYYYYSPRATTEAQQKVKFLDDALGPIKSDCRLSITGANMSTCCNAQLWNPLLRKLTHSDEVLGLRNFQTSE